MLNMIAQIVITYHNDRAGQPLVDDTCHSKGVNPSNKIMVFFPGLATGRTDRGVHITMMSHEQYTSQVRSTDLAQLEQSDISPMILRSLVAGRSFARLPFLCPPHPIVQARTKESMESDSRTQRERHERVM